MDNNPGMDIPTDLESLQATLKAMARKDVLDLCDRAKISASTIQKFRAGGKTGIAELGGGKVLALLAAMREKAAESAAADTEQRVG